MIFGGRCNLHSSVILITILTLCDLLTPLTGDRPPSVYLEGSSNVYVSAGSVVSLTCVSQPIENITYVWQKDGTDIVDIDSYTIRGKQLSVPADKTGTYRCLASNRFGTAVSNSTTILQAYFKDATRRPTSPITASKGASLHLKCDLSNIKSAPPPVVTWSSQCPRRRCPNNRLIKNSDERFTLFDDGSILVHALSDDDAASKGQFKCTIENKIVRKSIHRSFEVILERKIANLNSCTVSKTQTVLVGNSAELYCICNTMKDVRLEWRKGDRYLGNNTRLYIDNIKDSDNGQYTCQANHITLTTTLDVQSSPVIVDSSLVNDGVYKEDKVTFKCFVKGVPKPKVQWIINGKDLVNSELKDYSVRRNVQELTFDADESRAVQCNVSNIHGYVIGSGYMMVMSHDRPEYVTHGARASSSTTVSSTTLVPANSISSTSGSVVFPSAATTTEPLPRDIVPDITRASAYVIWQVTTPHGDTHPGGGLAAFFGRDSNIIIIAVVTMVCLTFIILGFLWYRYKKHAVDRRTAASLSHISSYIHGPMDPNEYIDRGSIFTDDSGFSWKKRIEEPRNSQEMVPLNTAESSNTPLPQSASDVHIVTNL